MKNILKKINGKWFLLFLFTFFSLAMQAQYSEDEALNDWITEALNDDDNSRIESDGFGGWNDVDVDDNDLDLVVTEMDNDQYDAWLASGGWEDTKDHSEEDMKKEENRTDTHYVESWEFNEKDPTFEELYGDLFDVYEPYEAPEPDDEQYPDDDNDTSSNNDTTTEPDNPKPDDCPTVNCPSYYRVKRVKAGTCDCAKEYWLIDKDGDGWYGSKEERTSLMPPSPQHKISSMGKDCDGDTIYNITNICKEICKTSKDDLQAMFGLSNAKATLIANIINKYALLFDIDTKEKMQHFLAQAGKETSGFKNLVNEDLDYTVQNLLDTFKSRFSQTDPNKLDPDDYAHKPEKIGEFVYGGRNGNTQPGDGYLYRGRGAIQITGRTHYTNFSNYFKANFNSSVDVLKNPDLISTNLEIAIISGMWFFKTEVIDKLKTPIDANTPVLKITNKINRRESNKKKEERKKIFDEKVKPNAKCN